MNTHTKILVPHGIRQELGNLFKCSQPFVRKVLNGEQTYDSRAYKMRNWAILKGGVEIKPTTK